MPRKLWVPVGGLVAILVAVVLLVGKNLDSIVKKAITKIGSDMTGVSVSVDKVGIVLAEGRGEIGGLVVDNPRGYKGPHAFSLGSIVLALDRTAETADVVVVRELTIDAPDIVFDKTDAGSNIEAIQQNVDAYTKAHAGESDRAADAKDADAPTRFIVESLQIRDGKIRLMERDRVIDLPAVRLRDLGKSQGGATGAEIASIVLKQITQATVSAAARALAQEGKEQLKDEIKGRRRPGRD